MSGTQTCWGLVLALVIAMTLLPSPGWPSAGGASRAKAMTHTTMFCCPASRRATIRRSADFNFVGMGSVTIWDPRTASRRTRPSR